MPILLMLWGGAQKAFGAVLTFCSKPPGSWIAAALGLMLGFWWYGHHQYAAGVSHCEAQHAEAAANELARQSKVIADADTRAVARSVITDKKNTENQKVIVYVKEKAAAMAGASDVCLDAATADGLRLLK
jgi:hypothetical protein